MSDTIRRHLKARQTSLEFAFINVTRVATTHGIHLPVAITREAHLYHVMGPTDQFGETADDRLSSIVVGLPGKGSTLSDSHLTPCTCYDVTPFPHKDPHKYPHPRCKLTAFFGPDENDELAFTIMMPEEACTQDHGARNGPHVVPLPDAPQTKSPVPWLTSIHAIPGRGDYGDRMYPGNCSGKLIYDLIKYYSPDGILDPMSGSGTCADVATQLEIPCRSFDLSDGFNAANPASFNGLGQFDFVWLHPPYWNLIQYNRDERCLSNAATLEDFLKALRQVLENCLQVLRAQGTLAILIGDITRGGKHLGLPFLTFNVASDLGLKLAAPEIIRFSHGASSSRKSYSSSFIPRLHDVCLVLKR